LIPPLVYPLLHHPLLLSILQLDFPLPLLQPLLSIQLPDFHYLSLQFRPLIQLLLHKISIRQLVYQLLLNQLLLSIPQLVYLTLKLHQQLQL